MTGPGGDPDAHRDQFIRAIIFAMLEQAEFSSLDHELFNLLAGHAATALCLETLSGQAQIGNDPGILELLKR
jgi:hypothetical protein